MTVLHRGQRGQAKNRKYRECGDETYEDGKADPIVLCDGEETIKDYERTPTKKQEKQTHVSLVHLRGEIFGDWLHMRSKVEVTGAARLYRAASRERSERG
jgi:hypothetical protein